MFITMVTIQARCSDISGGNQGLIANAGWFYQAKSEFSRNLAKNNENCLTYAKANHYFKTFWQFKSPF